MQLKIKFADFNVITRRTTLSASTDDGQALYCAALELLERSHQGKPVRLTGVSVQSLDEEGPQQLGLFSAPPARSTKLNVALDRIAERFGSNAITTADLTQSSAAVDEDERWGRH